MKIKISSLPGEEWIVAGITAFINQLCPGTKIHKSEAHPPYKHTYLTTKKPEKPTGARDKA